jgi:hypothetical protein
MMLPLLHHRDGEGHEGESWMREGVKILSKQRAGVVL